MDNLATITNKCTDEKFQGYKFIEPTVTSSFPNDDALQTLLKGDADAMWVCKYIVVLFYCTTCVITLISTSSIGPITHVLCSHKSLLWLFI
jgi:hypothetical protein